MGYTLYGSWLSGPSYKVGLMLSLSGSAFTYKAMDLAKGMHKAPDFLTINRYGQVPALKHNGAIIVQSNVILDYLAEQTGKFQGQGPNRWKAKEWLAWEADRLAPHVNRTRFFTRFAPNTDPIIKKYFRDAAEMGLKVLDGFLGSSPFVAGNEPTIGDIGCWAPLSLMDEGGLELGTYPNVKTWSNRLKALPGFKMPYDLLPKSDAEIG